MARAERHIKVTLDFVLQKGSKEAHLVSIEPIAHQIGRSALTMLEEHGYTISEASVNTLLAYVRHNSTKVIRRTVKRGFRIVS